MNLTTLITKARPSRRRSGLTLLEMMVATGLLVIIVVALTAMFIQVQKAFKSGLKQTDVFEGGRAVVEMMARDLEQLSDAQLGPNNVNFFFGQRANSGLVQTDGQTNIIRTNQLFDVFALSRINTTWFGTGYAVSNSLNGGVSSLTPLVGTLYRYSISSRAPLYNSAMFTNFLNSAPTFNTSFNRIVDGIIHFQVRAFDQNGQENTNRPTLSYPLDNSSTNALPHYLELELGILEPQTLEQARAIGNAAALQAFLERQAGKVHIFRQQIPIRAAALQ